MISIRKKVTIGAPLRSGFLNFSQKTDCGLALLAELARNDGKTPLSLRDIAHKKGLSFFYLQKVAVDLRKAGIIAANRGKFGGYRLVKSSSDTTLIEVLEALEGPVSVMHCLAHSADQLTCAREHTCGVKSGFGMLNQVILQTLTNLTLSDFLSSSWNKKATS